MPRSDVIIYRETNHVIRHIKEVDILKTPPGTKNVHNLDFRWMYHMGEGKKKVLVINVYQPCIIYNIPSDTLMDELVNLHKTAFKAALYEFRLRLKNTNFSYLKYFDERETISGLMPHIEDIAELLAAS